MTILTFLLLAEGGVGGAGATPIEYLAKKLDNMGMNYALGIDKKQNFKKSFYYFKRASDMNYAPAQYHVGVAYENGYWVKKI